MSILGSVSGMEDTQKVSLTSALEEIRERFSAAPPADLDPEVLSLCRAMNAFPGIVTIESCCGHGNEPFRIWFMATSLEALPSLLYWFDACHTGQYGWSVRVHTDCSADHATFTAEGPCGAYEAAESIAKDMREAVTRSLAAP